MSRLLSILFLVILSVQGYAQSEFAYQVSFSDLSKISDGGKDESLFLKIRSVIDAVPAGEDILICVFKFNDEGIINSLIKAQDRGVNVEIILNKGESSQKENEYSSKVLKEHFKRFYHINNNISDGSIVHNKFILFSKVVLDSKEFEHVVLQTSTNFVSKDQGKVQDLMLFSDATTYYCYRDYWYNIRVLGETDNIPSYTFNKCYNPSTEVRTFFYPKRKNEEAYGKDDIEKILKNMDPASEIEIYFLHAKWNKNRDNFLDELDELQESGARITVIANETIDDKILETLKDIDTHFYIVDKDVLTIHSKIILIKSVTPAGEKNLILTGSHNLTEKSLEKNFEVLLVLDQKELFDQYYSYISDIIQIVSSSRN